MLHIKKFENFVPIDNEVSEILSYLEENYPVKERKVKIFDDRKEIWKFIMINDKPVYITGLISIKSDFRKKLKNELLYKMNEYEESSINKAIKIYFDKNK